MCQIRLDLNAVIDNKLAAIVHQPEQQMSLWYRARCWSEVLLSDLSVQLGVIIV